MKEFQHLRLACSRTSRFQKGLLQYGNVWMKTELAEAELGSQPIGKEEAGRII
ncbi:unnamed protein product [Staurois parvus]|uniref:Uncharacterized protein n=1 Tax=Staurois parvus TaxID=386267 RepID=A0ABN9FV73_9NEOB|nr:unnamed protein product [Staurois parvus]